MSQDYYAILGVSPTATNEEIKRAYRKLAHQYHPDKAGGNEEKFKEVNEAYQVLNDKKKRSHYDQFGSHAENMGGGSGFNVNFEDFGRMGDIFEQFFGRAERSGQVRRGDDIQIDATISFIESAHGVNKNVKVRIYRACSNCRGSGAEPNTPIRNCQTCHGTGQITNARQTILGVYSQSVVCPDCRGIGQRPDKPCTTCRGVGRQIKNQTLSVAIPAGIANGQQLRLAGKGEVPAFGGVNGDIYVKIHVMTDNKLQRDGNNIRSFETISFAEAALGTVRNIDTVNGPRSLTIAAGTQPGTQLRLAAQGFPSLNGGRTGDHIVTVTIEVPKKLSHQQRQLLAEFQGLKPKRGLLF